MREAAERLAVSDDAVRKLLASGTLPGTKLGRDWLVDLEAVEARRRIGPSGGRPLSAATSWGIILEGSREVPNGVPSRWEAPARRRAKAWLGRHTLPDEASRLRARARSEVFDAHPSQVPRLLEREHLLRTGVSAAREVGLVGGQPSTVEVYAPAGFRGGLIRMHGLMAGEGPVLIRWIDDDLWDVIAGFTAPGAPVQSHQGQAPRMAILLDLLESRDPRARREAARGLAT